MQNNLPKLIILYGFAGIGKSTIAKKIKDNSPLSLCIEGDVLITKIGDWLNHEDAARGYVYEMTKSLVSTHLQSGHDVILPYLLVKPTQAEEFESKAKNHGAMVFEIYLKAPMNDCIDYLLQRGTWGEEGAPPITDADIPMIQRLYIDMENALKTRTNCKEVDYKRGQIEETYQTVQEVIWS